MKPADLGHRLGPSDGRQHPSVSVDKWKPSAWSRTLLDQLGDITALLHRAGRNQDDRIFRRGGEQLLLSPMPAAKGFSATFSLGLQLPST